MLRGHGGRTEIDRERYLYMTPTWLPIQAPLMHGCGIPTSMALDIYGTKIQKICSVPIQMGKLGTHIQDLSPYNTDMKKHVLVNPFFNQYRPILSSFLPYLRSINCALPSSPCGTLYTYCPLLPHPQKQRPGPYPFYKCMSNTLPYHPIIASLKQIPKPT